jgi:hypothetical protein
MELASSINSVGVELGLRPLAEKFLTHFYSGVKLFFENKSERCA